MARRRILVLGGTLAGPTAAARARELDEDAEITIVQRGGLLSFSFAGLHHHLSGEVPSLADLDQQDATFFRDFYGVNALLNTEATALDVEKHTLTVKSSSGEVQTLGWDSFIFALGAESIASPGLAGTNVLHLRTFADVSRLKAIIAAGGKRVAVVGAGSFGIEATDGLVRAGANVTLIEKSDHLLPRFSPAISAVLLEHLSAKATVALGVTVKDVVKDGDHVRRLVLSDKREIDVDAVVVCVGVRPRTALLAKAGIRLGDDGSVAVNERAEVASAPGVYACGASVAVPTVVTGQSQWWAQAAIADKVAQVAGENAAGENAGFAPFTGSMLVRAVDVTVGRAGLSFDEAVKAFGHSDVDRTLVPGRSHETWFPGSQPLTVELFSQRDTGLILGVEACGASGVDKRIDVAAAALAGGLTVEKLAWLDLGFAGAFNAIRDVLNTAAALAVAERTGSGHSITPTEFFARDDWQIVDVRTHPEGPGLPRAKALPLAVLRERLTELDKERPTVVYSSSGRRGWLAMRLLRHRGFFDVRNLSGGLQAVRREQQTTTTKA